MDSIEEIKEYPLIPLREIVAFPSTIIQIVIGRKKSIVALQKSVEKHDNFIMLSSQKNQIAEDPTNEEIYSIGVIAKIQNVVKRSNGSYRVTIRGISRGEIVQFLDFQNESYCLTKVRKITDINTQNEENKKNGLNLLLAFREYLKYRKIKMQGIETEINSNNLSSLTDIIVSIMKIPTEIKQSLLEDNDIGNRIIRIFNILKAENIKNTHKKASIFETVGEESNNEINEYKMKLKTLKFPKDVKDKVSQEIKRLESMPPFSAEGGVIRYYIDWIFSIPWMNIKSDEIDLIKASKILEDEHYGLHKVKDRILDYLAVRILKKKPDGEVICLLGPPGVGKSSLAKSIANAINREFVRISLGGLKDEAEIRGHRRTYIGAYPGQIVKGIKKAKCINPVFLLDEIDKIDSNFKGDPASALMEVLDPELNTNFNDHYLDLEIDLSKVFFITTANSIESIPGPLRDRLEIIEISGYTEIEKLNIAKQFLIKKQARNKGLESSNYSISKKDILYVINNYTREAGVRELERKIAIIMRKIARNVVNKTSNKIKINKQRITEFLGIPRYNKEKILKKSEIGVALGLAWTAFGGEILLIESRNIRGKGDLILTGRLGEIMKESSSTAFSYVKLKLYELGFDIDIIEKYNYHLHIPKGAVPKEGPSAGITLAVSMISLILGIPVKNKYAMTGEITLRGAILPVGGIKEKVIAAHRYGVFNLIIPFENQKEYEEEVPDEIKSMVKVNFMDNMDDVLKIVLTEQIKIDSQSNVIKHFSEQNIQ